jgi:tRNA pseudouridine55 synthase
MSDLKIEELIPGSILIVDKPKGITSHDVIDQVRNKYGTMSVGHAGTLDPLATGLLIVCTGAATKTIEQLMGFEKEYTGTVFLGAFR